ncbi:hypothetical protein SESBI_15787, partial [Sesbania bispinosa]
ENKVSICLTVFHRSLWILHPPYPLSIPLTFPNPNILLNLTPQLNSTNYPPWYKQFHSLLVARDLEGYVPLSRELRYTLSDMITVREDITK